MAIAARCSVTVSIAALTRGAFNVIAFVSLVLRDTSLGRTEDDDGMSKRSSKVNANSIFSGNIGGSFSAVEIYDRWDKDDVQ